MTWTFIIPRFRPTPLNDFLFAKVKDRIRLKKGDREVVAYYFYESGIPKATGRRRVSVEVTMPGTLMDPDSPLKSLFDCLVSCGALLKDDAAHCEIGRVLILRGKVRQTVVMLEEVT